MYIWLQPWLLATICTYERHEFSLSKLFGISSLVILLPFFHEIAVSRQPEKSFGALNRMVLLSKQRKVF